MGLLIKDENGYAVFSTEEPYREANAKDFFEEQVMLRIALPN